MTVPTHFRFSFRGVFTNTPEIWNFGCHFRRDVAASPDLELTSIHQDQVTAAFVTLCQGGGASMSSGIHATDWRAYKIGTDGKMQGNPLVVDVHNEAGSGGAAVRYPPQIALVVTLVSLNRGPARFGRMYLPGPAEGMSPDHRLSIQAASDYAEQVTQFLKSISNAIDVPNEPISVAGCNVSDRPSGSGTLQEIDHVEVGRVLDTLRTRRDQLLEERHVHGHIDW